jgi:hypothetical protein
VIAELLAREAEVAGLIGADPLGYLSLAIQFQEGL